MMIYDSRWEGSHGIGRFATELHARLPECVPVALTGGPSHPLDPFRLRFYLNKEKPELFFSPGYNPPFGRPCPFAFCVHDLNHLFIKENSSILKRAYYRYIVRPSIHRARIVFTGSEFSKSQICEWSGARSEEVMAVGYGVSDSFVLQGPRYDNSRPYFLCVGNHKSHKNLVRAIQAFAWRFSRSEFMILFTGTASSQLKDEIGRLGIADQTKFLGYVSDAELACLYRGAVALVFVSLYEGFGLPIIECMACGTPVLTANTTATPEAAGDAAILVDPYDVEAIADGMHRLADDSMLTDYLRVKGLARATGFSWDRIGNKVRDVLSACV